MFLPDGFEGNYLDYGFNDLVPVVAPDGTIVEVRMCAPAVRSISNTGEVKVVFAKPIKPIPKALYKTIARSGVIQLQIKPAQELTLPDDVVA